MSFLSGYFGIDQKTKFKYFYIDWIESSTNYVEFFKKVRKEIDQEIKYILYYRKKTNSVYFVEFLDDDHWKTKKVWKKGILSNKAMQEIKEEHQNGRNN